MRVETQRGLPVLRASYEFLTVYEIIAAHGPITKHVETLGRIVDRLEAHAADQEENARAYRASAKGAQLKIRELRVELMRPVARTAQRVFGSNPELSLSLAMPKAKGYEEVIAAALAMAGRASEQKDRFVEAGFSEDFADRIRQCAAELRDAINERAAHFGKRSAASAGMVDELSNGRDLLRMLDDMVASKLASTPARLAEWRTITRFARHRRGHGEVTIPTSADTNLPPTPGVARGPASATTAEPDAIARSSYVP